LERTKFEEYIKVRYQTEIEWYDKKAIANQFRNSCFQIILIICSSITPVLIALSFSLRNELAIWISIVFAVITAISGSVLKIFKFYDNWMNYRTICETLRKEIHLYNAALDEYRESPDKEALFVERVEALISREHTLWLKTFTTDERSSSSLGRLKHTNTT
jgi:hypothetical protein